MINTETSVEQLTREALEAGEGVLRLAPTWVPRSYLVPGGDSNWIRAISMRTERIAGASMNAGLPRQHLR